MPVYEYECGSCGGRFEVIRKFSDPVLTECNLCHATGVRKILSPTAFVLKGGGWYTSDYPSADRKAGLIRRSPHRSRRPLLLPAPPEDAHPAPALQRAET